MYDAFGNVLLSYIVKSKTKECQRMKKKRDIQLLLSATHDDDDDKHRKKPTLQNEKKICTVRYLSPFLYLLGLS